MHNSILFPQVSLKAYREFLKRLRRQSQEEINPPGYILRQAKKIALAQIRRKQESETIDPKRAFARLRHRLIATKEGWKLFQQEKKEIWKATYFALREKHTSNLRASEQAALLGSDGLVRTVVLGTVGLLSSGVMHVLNNTEVAGRHFLQTALSRPAGQGMLSVTNHRTALDDPLVLAAIMPPQSLFSASNYRWGTCATDRCFQNSYMGAFFRAGKTLPMERGGGLEQAGLKAAESRLCSGDWVHVFPEGTRSRDGKMGPLKRGVGHLIAACDKLPLVLPIVHSGMENVLPQGHSLPRTGQQVKILIGQPIAFDDLCQKAKEKQWSRDVLSQAMTERVAEVLYSLKARVDSLQREDVVAEEAFNYADPALLPLILHHLDGLQHSWTRLSTHLKWEGHLTRYWGACRKAEPSYKKELLALGSTSAAAVHNFFSTTSEQMFTYFGSSALAKSQSEVAFA